jgi:hypothetical protein
MNLHEAIVETAKVCAKDDLSSPAVIVARAQELYPDVMAHEGKRLLQQACQRIMRASQRQRLEGNSEEAQLSLPFPVPAHVAEPLARLCQAKALVEELGTSYAYSTESV